MFDNIRTDWVAVLAITAFMAWLIWLDRRRKEAARKQETERIIHERMAAYKVEAERPAQPAAEQEHPESGRELYARLLSARLDRERRRNNPVVGDRPDYITLWRNEGVQGDE
jgi:hypothetical protein